MKLLHSLLLGMMLSVSAAHAQVNVVPVNGGTGSLVSVPIPGGSGLSVTVGTGTAAIPLQDIRVNPNAVNITTGDDSFNSVPLGFDFPFYGRVFSNSWAMTNGLVTFQDPWQSGLGGACCEGINLRTTASSAYNYTIFGLHSDLYSSTTNNQYYLRGANEMTYGWYGVSQCCGSQGGNSFEIKIDSAGLVDTRVAGAMISGNRVTSGMTGNLANGEFYQAYHGSGLNITAGSANIFSWQALGGTGAVDLCTVNPLSSPACAGYQAAYTVQQCVVSALYDPSCPGYQAAYLQQQCAITALYSTSCVGHQQAYETQQCSLNSLYSTNCPGYAAAYLTQQCGVNPLYSTTCSGYNVAYKSQQCSISALYATDCPEYAAAYLSQQCSLNELYDRTCPNYSAAYAKKNVLGIGTTTTAATIVLAQSNTDPAAQAAPLVSDPVVNSVVSTKSTTANAEANPAAAVKITAPAAAGAAADATKEEKKSDSKTNTVSGPNTDNKPAAKPQTAREQLAEQRREKARADAVKQGKEQANNMGQAADLAAQIAVQNVVIQAMGFTPGFDSYNQAILPDSQFYRPYQAYPGQRNIDSGSGRRLFGGSDRVHQDMIDSQYNLGK